MTEFEPQAVRSSSSMSLASHLAMANCLRARLPLRSDSFEGDAMGTNYLSLTLHRLQAHQEWDTNAGGLTFVLPQTGAAKCVSGAFDRGVRAGDVLVLNGAGGKLCASGENEMVFGFFSMRVEHMFPLFDVDEIGLLQNITADFKGPKLYPASDPLAVECHRLLGEAPATSSQPVDLGHRSQLLRIAAAIFAVEFKNTRGQGSAGGFIRVEDHMIQVLEKLTADELLAFSVDEMAGKFHYSRRHLNRLFHQHFGFSICGLKMEMRLLKAVSLLQNPDLRIINVAEESGFNHLGLFNTCFKKRFGASPGEWRKLNAGRASAPQGQAGYLHSPLLKSGSGPFGRDSDDSNPPRSAKLTVPKPAPKARLITSQRPEKKGAR